MRKFCLNFPFLFLLVLLCLVFPQCKKNSDTVIPVELPGDWLPTNGPGNGLVVSLASFGDVLLAGVSGRGMYHSPDAGSSWTCDTSAIPNNTTPIAVVQVNDSALYTVSDKLYRSWNKGKEWHAVSNISAYTISLAVNETMIVTGTEGTQGISVSKDGGQSWNSHIPVGGNYRNSVAISGQNIFVGTSGAGVYFSSDSGLHWDALNSGLGSLDIQCLKTVGSLLYAGTLKGLYMSSDQGRHWILLNNGLSQELKISCFAFSGNSILAGSPNGIWVSRNNGTSWAAASGNLPETDVQSLAFSGLNFLAGTASGLYVSTSQGMLWDLLGIPVTTVNSMCSNNLVVYAAAGWNTQSVYGTMDHGRNWNIFKAQLPAHAVSCIAFSDGFLAAGTDSGVYVSQNSGMSWTKSSGGIAGSDIRSIGMNGPVWFAGTYSTGFFGSQDHGFTWNKINTPLPDNNYVYSIFFHGSAIYAGTSHGGMLVSQDSGKTWHVNSQMPVNTVISSFAAKGSTIYAGTFNGVWESDDNGLTWLATTLENQEVYNMIIVGNYVFAAVKSWGVFGTTVGSSRWWLFCSGLPYYTTVTSIATDGSLLLAGTKGFGVWTHRLN